jgi:hypothetical protein
MHIQRCVRVELIQIVLDQFVLNQFNQKKSQSLNLSINCTNPIDPVRLLSQSSLVFSI